VTRRNREAKAAAVIEASDWKVYPSEVSSWKESKPEPLDNIQELATIELNIKMAQTRKLKADKALAAAKVGAANVVQHLCLPCFHKLDRYNKRKWTWNGGDEVLVDAWWCDDNCPGTQAWVDAKLKSNEVEMKLKSLKERKKAFKKSEAKKRRTKRNAE
jgi:hypothetical protein